MEEEKQRLAHIQQFKSLVKLDVGGFTFTTTRVTLCRFPDSMLGAMFSGRHEVETDEDLKMIITLLFQNILFYQYIQILKKNIIL